VWSYGVMCIQHDSKGCRVWKELNGHTLWWSHQSVLYIKERCNFEKTNKSQFKISVLHSTVTRTLTRLFVNGQSYCVTGQWLRIAISKGSTSFPCLKMEADLASKMVRFIKKLDNGQRRKNIMSMSTAYATNIMVTIKNHSSPKNLCYETTLNCLFHFYSWIRAMFFHISLKLVF